MDNQELYDAMENFKKATEKILRDLPRYLHLTRTAFWFSLASMAMSIYALYRVVER